MSKAAVSAELQRLYGADGHAEFVGRQMSGWYLQQLLKLGVAQHVPNLSPTFLVWDPDMIVLWPMQVLGRALHSLPFLLNLSSSVHRIIQLDS